MLLWARVRGPVAIEGTPGLFLTASPSLRNGIRITEWSTIRPYPAVQSSRTVGQIYWSRTVSSAVNTPMEPPFAFRRNVTSTSCHPACRKWKGLISHQTGLISHQTGLISRNINNIVAWYTKNFYMKAYFSIGHVFPILLWSLYDKNRCSGLF
jgi:hypothetical protein